MNCIFCKILNDEAEASFVFKGDRVSAFMDLNPINRGHVLVVPNDHSERFSEVQPNVAGEILQVAHRILKAIEKSNINCEGANLFLSDGEIAGQEVPHAHLHIAPRYEGDGHRMGFSGVDSRESVRERLNTTAQEIISNI